MRFALERIIQFLGEQRTELYKWYGEGVAELKIGLDAKTSCGAGCSADWQARRVRTS